MKMEWTIGDRLQKSRVQAGFDKKAFSRKTGISPATILKHESGEMAPKLTYLITWAQVTGATVDWLLTGEEAPLVHDPDECTCEDSEDRKMA